MKTFKTNINCTCHRHVEGWQRDCNSMKFITVLDDVGEVDHVSHSSHETIIYFSDGREIENCDIVCGFGRTREEAEEEFLENLVGPF